MLGVFDDMILALASALPDETPEERANRRAIAAMLKRLRRFMQTHFTFPAWHADAVAQALGIVLGQGGFLSEPRPLKAEVIGEARTGT